MFFLKESYSGKIHWLISKIPLDYFKHFCDWPTLLPCWAGKWQGVPPNCPFQSEEQNLSPHHYAKLAASKFLNPKILLMLFWSSWPFLFTPKLSFENTLCNSKSNQQSDFCPLHLSSHACSSSLPSSFIFKYSQKSKSSVELNNIWHIMNLYLTCAPD